MGGIRPYPEEDLHQKLVGDAIILPIDRPAVLGAELAELARPKRQDGRCASIVDGSLPRAIGPVVAQADEPASVQAVVG